MNFRTGSNVADLSLDEDGGIDCFEGFDRGFGLLHVLLERERGSVEDDSIKPRPRCFCGIGQGVCMICVEKYREIEFLPQTPHESRNLADSCKLAFALRHTNHDWDL